MSNHTVEFTLKQHTPIIHFQSEQRGATLRATELKPKLDRFITKKLKDTDLALYEKFEDIINDPQVFPEDATGSNVYKISVELTGTSLVSTPKAYVNKKKELDKSAYQAPYFADASKSILATGDIKVTIKSFNITLLELLKHAMDYVLVYENFGTRQSKGFGSFLRDDLTEETFKKVLKNHQNPIFVLGSYRDYKQAFLTIDTFYKELKMGINKPYKKSLIFKYMCNVQHLGWEKKFLKNKFPEIVHGDHAPVRCEVQEDDHFRYIRAMLGLAEHNEYRPSSGKKQIKIASNERDAIQRFKSPITFKVMQNTIYVTFDDSYTELLNRSFTFSLQGKKESLMTPETFDMTDFLRFVCKETSLKELTL